MRRISDRSRSLGTLAAFLVLAATAALPVAGEPPDELAPRHREWLEEVDGLISDEERAAFLALAREYRREVFVKRFWEVRDPFPQTRRNEFREAWEERLAAVRERFGGLEDARARVLLLAGEPRTVEPQPCPQRLASAEIWRYPLEGGRAGAFSLVFVAGPGGRRLWSPREGLASLLVFSERDADFGLAVERALREGCPRGDDLVADLELAVDWTDLRRLAAVPQPSDEWVGTFMARSTELPATAETFLASLDLAYPARYQSRTVVQVVLAVPVEQLLPSEPQDGNDSAPGAAPQAHQFVVDGEILRDDRLFEQFRYRFEIPAAEAVAGRIPLVIQRYLRPGDYTAVLRAHNRIQDRYHRVERRFTVPRVSGPAFGDQTAAEAAAAATTELLKTRREELGIAPRLAEANRNLDAQEHRLVLRVPEEGLLTGTVRVEASASSERIAKVAFVLNGQRQMTKARPPYSVELNLGHAPRLHRLTAIAYDERDNELARARLALNVGPHRFAVRLLEPRPGRYESSLRARAEVDLPRGSKLDRLELFLDETRIATLYQPPFAQPLLLPDDGNIRYVRAVAYLEDGNMAEDLVFVNAPENLDSLQVDFVELYTSVLDRSGRPVEGLPEESFEILEDGHPQRIVRFEQVRDLPIHAGVVIDASTSMAEELDRAEKAALKFFQRVIQPRDRAAVFMFNDQPELRVPLTNSLEVLAGGLAGLQAEGDTALYDAIVYGVYYFAGIRGKRALVLLTDGEDSNSRHSFDEALDFARRAGIAVYSIGLNLSTRDFEVRNLLRRLARETGGESFFIDRAAQLDSIYERIEEELRTQYLLGYQSSQQASEAFRQVEVRIGRPGLRAKTIPGYYP